MPDQPPIIERIELPIAEHTRLTDAATLLDHLTRLAMLDDRREFDAQCNAIREQARRHALERLAKR